MPNKCFMTLQINGFSSHSTHSLYNHEIEFNPWISVKAWSFYGTEGVQETHVFYNALSVTSHCFHVLNNIKYCIKMIQCHLQCPIENSIVLTCQGTLFLSTFDRIVGKDINSPKYTIQCNYCKLNKT